MKSGVKIAIVVLLAVAVAATFALRGGKRAEYVAAPEPPAASTPAQGAATQAPAPAVQGAAVLAPALPPVQSAAAIAEPVPAKPATVTAPRAVAAAAKPRLLELGSMRCMSCIEMAKVLDALRASQKEKLKVDFIDVFEQPEAADRHKISLIPTQIFYDSAGKEIFRHTGYFSHDDILAKFRDLGVKL
jgi:thioredoxin 1